MRWALRALPVLAAAALAVAVVTMFLDLRRLQGGERAAAEALAAARAYAPDMLSYDYRTIDRDMARAGAHATGRLAEHYRRLGATLGPQARERRTVQQAVVAAAGVESATPREVRVLLFVNMVTTRSGPGQETAKQQVSQGRARLVMVTQGDGWRASRLSTLLGDTPVP
ncbi:hypothetical protein [Microbispora sp. NPDC046933]|uniref:hypothetical protein n=1 Tax=Microbispora sp. NPDC046933 TaxID=3155618 RepID=UPI0034105423